MKNNLKISFQYTGFLKTTKKKVNNFLAEGRTSCKNSLRQKCSETRNESGRAASFRPAPAGEAAEVTREASP